RPSRARCGPRTPCRTRRAMRPALAASRSLYRRRARMEGSRSSGRGAVGSGVLTGISTAAVSGSAADGVYLAVVLVASALRVVVLPRFVAARDAGRLPHEFGTWAAGLAGPLG